MGEQFYPTLRLQYVKIATRQIKIFINTERSVALRTSDICNNRFAHVHINQRIRGKKLKYEVCMQR